MIKLYSVLAIIRRHTLLTFRDIHRIFELFFWPTFDLVIWGITSTWMQSYQVQDQANIKLMVLSGMVLWQVVLRAHFEVSINLIEELWSSNLVNLCVTPLTFSEWCTAVMIMGFVKSFFAALFGMVVAWLLFGVWVPALGWVLLPFILLLLISGWCLGFIASAILITLGKEAAAFVWAVGWLLAPFSAVFAPLALLPVWVHAFAVWSPITYVYEAMRTYVMTGKLSHTDLWYSLGLNCIYFVLCLLVLLYAISKSRKRGFARLEA